MSKHLTEIREFDVLAGSSIREASEEAIYIAKKNYCIVKFDFNGVYIKVYDFNTPKEIEDIYFRGLNTKDLDE